MEILSSRKRIDQCLFCRKRSCYTKIYTDDFVYDEIACDKHINDLEKHSDKILGKKNGRFRTHLSSTAKLKRGREYYVGGRIANDV